MPSQEKSTEGQHSWQTCGWENISFMLTPFLFINIAREQK